MCGRACVRETMSFNFLYRTDHFLETEAVEESACASKNEIQQVQDKKMQKEKQTYPHNVLDAPK